MTLDYSALSVAIPYSEVRNNVDAPRLIKGMARLAHFTVFIFLMFASIILGIALIGTTNNPAYLFAGLFLFFLFTWLTVVSVWIYEAKIAVKIKKFALSNGFDYTRQTYGPGLNGMIFDRGTEKMAENQVSGIYKNQHFEIGRYSYFEGSGSKRRQSKFSYMYVELPRHLPHMVLDTKSNNYLGLVNLPAYFKNNQKLQLEGNFNKYFDLYCPKEYERDALYIFTPDLMALLIDYGNKYDMEIIDNRLLIYGPTAFAFTQPKHLPFLFQILDTVGPKLESQSDNYVDGRVIDNSPDTVAKPGRRLKKYGLGR
jgi:hypothetical protein